MLEARHISYAYDSADGCILEDVSLSLDTGEVVALVGANGSGKSTVAGLLAGLLEPDHGEVLADGQSALDAWWRVGVVLQDPQSQLVSESVLDEVSFGPRNRGMSVEDAQAIAMRSLAQCGLERLAEAQTSELSGGEMQRLALAGMLATDPTYLVLDEATSQLDHASRAEFLGLVGALPAMGKGVLQVTHRMDEVLASDRVIAMDGGRIAWEGTPKELAERGDVLTLAGLSLDAEAERPSTRRADRHADGLRDRRLEARGVSVSRSGDVAVRDVSLAVDAGRVTLLTGPTGSGKTTTAHVLSGVVRPTKGMATLGGREVRIGEVGLCQQRPEDQVFCDTVLEDVAFGPKNEGLADAEAEGLAREALRALEVPERLWDRHPQQLSGGERRRVAIAGIVAMRPEAYVFDEPTAGLDGRGRRLTTDLVASLAEGGRPVVVVTHDVEDWMPVAGSRVEMRAGRVVDATHPEPDGVRERARRPSSALCGVPAALKAALLLALSAFLFLTESLQVLSLVAVAPSALLAYARGSVRALLATLRSLVVLVAFAFAANAIVVDGTADLLRLGWVGISGAGIGRGLVGALRIVSLCMSAATVGSTTTASDMARVLLWPLRPLRRAGLPFSELELLVMLTLRSLPMAIEEFRRMETAQLVRKAPLRNGGLGRRLGSWTSVLVPSVVALMRRSDELGCALRKRGCA